MSSKSANAVDTNDVQGPVDAILDHLGIRLTAGSLTVHLSEGKVQKVEYSLVFRPTKGLKRQSETA